MGVVGGTFTAGGAYSTKLVNGLVFAVGLCMVTSAGSELFTGNNLVMSVGGFTKSVSWGKVVKYWVICWIGNLVGSVLFAAIFTPYRHSGKRRYRRVLCQHRSRQSGRHTHEPVHQSDFL